MFTVGFGPVNHCQVGIYGRLVTVDVLSAQPDEGVGAVGHSKLLGVGLVRVEKRAGGESKEAGLHCKDCSLGDSAFPLVSAAGLNVRPGVREAVFRFLEYFKGKFQSLLGRCTGEVYVVRHLVGLTHDGNAAPALEHAHIAVGYKSVGLSLHILLHFGGDFGTTVYI